MCLQISDLGCIFFFVFFASRIREYAYHVLKGKKERKLRNSPPTDTRRQKEATQNLHWLIPHKAVAMHELLTQQMHWELQKDSTKPKALRISWVYYKGKRY